MKVQSLGHVVLRVSNLERAEAFYSGVLGLPVCARYKERQMVFFSLGDHHDFAIASVGEDAPPAARDSVGLAHVAFRLGDDLELLKKAKADLEAPPRAAPLQESSRYLSPGPILPHAQTV